MFKRFVDVVEVLVAVAAAGTVVLLFVASPTIATGEGVDPSAGTEVFSARCAGCHGPGGEGGSGPALAGEDALNRFAAADEVVRFVSSGVPGRMPGFETRLTPDEVEAVAHFVWEELGGR